MSQLHDGVGGDAADEGALVASPHAVDLKRVVPHQLEAGVDDGDHVAGADDTHALPPHRLIRACRRETLV